MTITHITPLGLPAVVLVFLYCIVAAVSGAGYYNWPPFSSLLYGSGAYAWLCDSSSNSSSSTDHPASTPIASACESQQISLVSMYSFGFVVSQLSGLMSGAILDIQGPRVTAMLGLAAGCIGWLGLSISNEGLRFHQLSMVFIGISASLNGLPGNWVSVLFPRRSSLVLSLISASFDASLAVPLILLKIRTYYVREVSFNDLMKAYALLVLAPTSIIAFFIYPKKTPEQLIYVEPPKSDQKYVNGNLRRKSSILTSKNIVKYTVNNNTRQVNRRITLINNTLWNQIWSEELWLFLLYFVFSSLRNTFFCLTGDQLGGKKLGQLIGLLSPLSCLPCYGFGLVVDNIGVLKTAQLINISGLMMFVTTVLWKVMLPYEGFLVLAAMFYVLSSSFIYGQMIIYISETFGLKYFGTLVGVASICDGMAALINTPDRKSVV